MIYIVYDLDLNEAIGSYATLEIAENVAFEHNYMLTRQRFVVRPE